MADVLDYNETRQTDAFSVEEVLVHCAWVDTNTFLLYVVIVIPFLAFAAEPFDGVISISAVAITCDRVEYLVGTAAIAFGLIAVLNFYGRSAVDTVLCVGKDC